MNCSLSTEQQLTFLGFVYKELEAKAEAKEAIDIKKYIKDFYNEALSKTGDQAKALAYTQILPKSMLMSYANKFNKLSNLPISLDELKETIKLFEDFDEVTKLVVPKKDNKPIIDAANLIKENEKKPKKLKKTLKQILTKIIEFVFKPQTPLSTTGQQGIKVKDLTDSQIASILRKGDVNRQVAQEAINDHRRKYGESWSNIKNHEEDFYYNFFHVFADALNTSNNDPSKVTINDHTGFKLKLINKSKISINKAKQSEQAFAERAGMNAYNSGTGAVVTDNDGNILYFDENYNVISAEIGLPIYHNLRKIEKPKEGKYDPGSEYQMAKYKAQKENPEITEYDGSMIQTPLEVAKNRFEPTDKFETLDQVKAADPALYMKYIKKAQADLQVQLKAMYDIRAYLMADPSHEILTDITSVSRGVINVNQSGIATWAQIDWAGSDIKPTNENTVVATRDNPALAEKSGSAYLRIPGNKSIELQKDNITDEDVEKLVNLLFDDVKEVVNNREVSVSWDTKKAIFEGFVLTRPSGVQISDNGNVFVKGVNITEKEDAKDLLTEALKEKTRKGSKFNKKHGQYRFKGTDIQGDFVDFSIEDGILSENVIPLSEHIKAHSTLKVIPNESNQIVYLNGYFTFDMPDMSLLQFQSKTEAKETIAELAALETEPASKVEVTVETIDEIDSKQELDIQKLQDEIDKEDQDESKKGKSENDELYRSKKLEMISSPQQRADAKAWWEGSSLQKYIGYDEMFDIVNSEGWASFKDSTITLYKGSDHTAIYHEAWHAFSQVFLSPQEKSRLYREMIDTTEGKKAVKAYKEELGRGYLNQKQAYLAVEELIAEEFRKYVMSGGKKIFGKRPARNTIFRRILNFLREVLGKITGIPATYNNTYRLNELFNELYKGELSKYSPSIENVYFKDTLYKSYDKNVSKEDSKKLLQSIDAIFQDRMDAKNIEYGNTKYSNAVFTGNPKIVNDLYKHAKNVMGKRALEMYAEARTLTGVEKKDKQRYAEILHTAWVKFGDSSDGLRRYHMDNSDLVSDVIKDIDEDTFKEAESDDVSVSFDLAKNSISVADYASNQILSLVRGLKKYDEDGKVVTNEFGFAEFTKWQTVWKTLISTLADNNDSPRIMKEALENIAPLTPWVNDLLAKLGPTDSPFDSVQDMWTGFWSAFFLSHEKLYDVLINEEFLEDAEGIVTGSTFEVLTGYASAVFRKAELDFRSHFKISDHPNPFIIDVEKVGNVLDLNAIILKFKNNPLTSNKDKYDFITSIGIPIAENNDIINGLSDVNAGKMYDKLVILHKHKYQITDIIKTLKENIPLENEKSEDLLKSETSNVNKILNLEAKHSGNYSNSSVMTADGQIAFEQTQMGTLSRMVKHINNSKTKQELWSIPSMSYLNPENNPSIEASNIMKSIFDKNGKKREGAKLILDNLDGTQSITNRSHSDLDYSTSTSKSDKYTRLQQDIYSFLVGGKAAMFTPADKGTIISFNIGKILTERSEDSNLYVDIGDFSKKGSEMNLGMEKTYKLLMPFLNGELKRIEKIKNDPNMVAIDGYTVPILDKEGNVKKPATGLALGIFDGIFNDEEDNKVKSEVLKYKSVEEIPGELHVKMMSQFNTYMSWQMKQTADVLDRLLFLDKNIKEVAEKSAGKKLNSEDLKKVVIAAYTANKFINNAESLVLFYGDISQYKDFDKRNPGINSTGRMFRSDPDFLDFINNYVGREFTKKHLNGATSKYTPFNGILQTAILKDNLVDSKVYEHYLEIATKAVGKEKAVNLLSPYKGMEEGDAQGWITLDTYRILGKASDRWSKEQDALYIQILNHPETVDPLKVLQYFPARKYQYNGPLAIKGLHANAFHKYSLMPLVPSVIQDTNLENLNNMMMEQGIDYAVYRTGSKVSNIVSEGNNGGDVIYKSGEDRVVDRNLTFTKNPIYLDFLKDQLDINSHFKNSVIFSTQLRKLVEEGLVENGVPIDYKPEIIDKDERKKSWEKARNAGETTPFYKKYKTYESKIEKLVHLRMAELTHQTLGSDGKTDISKLINFINKELERQDLTEAEKEFIKVDSKGQLIHDLSISPSASKIQKTLLSIVNRRLIRQKINGESLVQISSSLWEKATNATKAQLNEYRQDELKTYMLEGGVVPKGSINVYWGQAESKNSTKMLSNLAPRKFTWKERQYGSVEHAYQSNKSGVFDETTYDRYNDLKNTPGYGKKIRGKAVSKDFDNLKLMKDLVVTSFTQNSDSDQAKKLMKYEKFTHNTNTTIDKAFLQGLKLAQQKLSSKYWTEAKTTAMEVKVALQGNFKSLIHLQYDETSKVAVFNKRKKVEANGKVKYIKEINQKETLKRLNQLINSEEFLSNEDNVKMITMVGVRIPVQGLNSMEFMRVKEFLPPSAGNIIIPPAEIVAKSGSDFDIDKLTIMMPSIAMLSGRPEILKEYNGNLTPKDTMARLEELKLLIKEAKDEKNIAKNAADKKFESLQKAENLTPELLAEKAELLDPYIEASKKADSDKEKFLERITKFQGRDDLTPAQEKALDEAWEKLKYIEDNQDQIDEELAAAKLDFAVSKKLINSAEVSKSAESKAYKAAVEKLDNLKREQGALSPEAIENSIIFSIKEILEMESNFLPLITPNDTSLVLPKAELMSMQREYKDTEGAWGETEGISPTRYLEVGYNLYKHESNTIGKDTLGMGAVDNTFNSIFNRIGAYMNAEYTTSKHVRRADILMKHNKLNSVNISLSHIYDHKNENKVSEIINQLLNGWLDVAKKPWIFDLQGNKQLTPVMMFLLQAGVTFDNSIDFISNPIIKKYVEEQKIIKSAWAKAAGEAAPNPSAFRSQAQKNIFSELGILRSVQFRTKGGDMIVSQKDLYALTLEKTKGLDFTDKAKDIATMHEGIAMKDNDAIAGFLHYLELEKLANQITTIKSTLNYDTSRSTTLFDASKTKAKLAKLRENDLFPKELIDNFFKETPVGSFNISDFQLELWAPLFSVRNNSRVDDLLLEAISDFDSVKKMEKMFGSEETYVEEFKNGLISKLFLDEIKSFDIKDGYKGLEIKATEKDKYAGNKDLLLDKGVSVLDGVAYIDKAVLGKQFEKKLYSKVSMVEGPINTIEKKAMNDFHYTTLGLATVDTAAFTSESGKSDYINFSIEREYLRATNPFSEFSKGVYFKKAYNKNLQQSDVIPDESTSDREQRLLTDTYEQLLRDMALDNTLNLWKLFQSHNTAADQLFEIREMHPNLRKDFMIVNDFILSEGGRKNVRGKRLGTGSFKNLALRDNRVDVETFDVYYENMENLASKSLIPVDDIQGKLENARLNEFFARLPIVAFLQSGLDVKNSLSMMRAMPTDKITEIIESSIKKTTFTDQYLKAYKKKFDGHNARKNVSIRKRVQDYVTKPKSENASRSLTKNDFAIDVTINMSSSVTGIVNIYDVIRGVNTEIQTAGNYNVMKGEIVELVSNTTGKSVLVRATSDQVGDDSYAFSAISDEKTREGYSFSFEALDIDSVTPSQQVVEINYAKLDQLKDLIDNNPDVIFVLEGSEKSDDLYTDMGNVKNADNIMPIITRIRPSYKAKDLWSKNSLVNNKKQIEKSLDAIQELFDAGKKIAFINPSKGYGSYMLDKNSEGKIIDSESYKYLSTELLKRFNYSNKFSKVMTDTKALIKDNQDFKEFSIEIPFNEILEAQERLTCKT